MPINWSLFQPVDVGGKWREGWDRGQKRGEAIRLKSALAAFGANPSDPNAQGELAAASPDFALEMAKAGWKRQGEDAKTAMVAKFFADDPKTGVPPGINSKPKSSAELRAAARQLAPIDYEAARLMSEMADDAEAAEVRAAEQSVKGQTVKWETDPITGKRTALDMYGNPIGTNMEAFVRDRQGIPHSAEWAAKHPDEVQPPYIEQAPPGGSAFGAVPTDPSISYTNPADTPQQAEIRKLVMHAISQPGADVAAIWADAAIDGVYP